MRCVNRSQSALTLVARRAPEYTCPEFGWEVCHGPHGPLRTDPGPLRVVAGKVFTRADQAEDDREARAVDCRRGEEKGADPGPARAVLRPLLLRRAARALGRADRANPRRANTQSDAEAGAPLPHGASGTGVRGGDDRRVLQHRRSD